MMLLLLMLGSFSIGTLLNFTSTGTKTGVVYQKKGDEVFAADAGIEDGKWLIKYDYLSTRLTAPPYNAYDFTTNWTYQLGEQINSKNVNVTISNIWIPNNLAKPDPNQARTIIDAEKLVVTGSATESTATITVTYFRGFGEELLINKLGVWLPRGYTYVSGSSNLEANPGAAYYSVPTVVSHAGNQALNWSFNSANFTLFPGVNPQNSPLTATITFDFTASLPGGNPTIVAWTKTSGVADIPYAWDSDIKIFRIASHAGDTTIESYIAREEIRRLRSAISGDYRAIGNSLMLDTNGDMFSIRDVLLSNSSATANNIPGDADVAMALLYWSGWRAESSTQQIFSDTCSNLNNWNTGSAWTAGSGRFSGHYSSGGNAARYLTLKNSVNLTSYGSGLVSIAWDQWEGGTLEPDDGLDFSVSADGGNTWSANITAFRDDIGGSPIRYSYLLPDQYLSPNFKFRFYLQSMSESGEYAYLDNITITVMSPDTSVTFQIDGHQVYFDGNGVPRQGAQPLLADDWQLIPNYLGSSPHGFSYSAFRDVTQLIRTFGIKAPDPAPNHPGNGTYTVGGVTADTGDQLSYAAWSLLIVYSSPATAGHQLYLYDKFMHAGTNTDIDFDNDGQPGGNINGFVVPNQIPGEVNVAKLTAFVGEGDEIYSGDSLRFNGTALSNAQSPWNNVWNSQSPGISNDGIDIDTFDITWASGLLVAGATSAQINLPTTQDNWNVIYIMLSFRSETSTGGALTYRIW